MPKPKAKAKTENFNPDIVIINVAGIKEKVDLSKDLIIENVTPTELNAKLSVLPNLYSRWGVIRTKLDEIIEKKESNHETWMADKMTFISDDNKLSDTARKRLVRQKYGYEIDDYLSEIMELKNQRALADITRKGFSRQYFTIKEQVSLILGKRADAEMKAPSGFQKS